MARGACGVCQGRAVRLAELVPATDERVAARLLAVQRSARAVEAALIGNDRIPPLHEDVAALRAAPLEWLGAFMDDRLAGAVAVRDAGDGLDIDRLVVAPPAHRRGVGSVLVRAVVNRASSRRITVSTGCDNTPARTLHERLGFDHVGDEEVLLGLWVAHHLRAGGNEEAGA
ncbi:Acetyltransferase (GNAT) family protein [Modestobacter sp. DSM 44400]|uniref:GNAT family N-acetyltransferase n=1 Tax=Modestobacter sp. DSM 44400 TaxID=1550230 RepID=UPI00089D83F1|nr:GNAT family N-acetyltransferase [Modestobacter sp. DSM 44400]SDX96271.1 Acetyltransferase (GNAT) family protein [Modestobacter sp. DSM 44400]